MIELDIGDDRDFGGERPKGAIVFIRFDNDEALHRSRRNSSHCCQQRRRRNNLAHVELSQRGDEHAGRGRLPCEPATAIEIFCSESSPSSLARLMIGIPRSVAAAISGLSLTAAVMTTRSAEAALALSE